MRTKEAILAHLGKVPYDKPSRSRIIGFLLGKGIVEKGEIINFTKIAKDGKVNRFDDFYDWFNGNECPLCGLLNFLCVAQDDALNNDDDETADEIPKYIGFLVDSFDCIVEEEAEDEK